LWVLASYCAIQHTGGPEIPFKGGRVDAPAEKAIAPGRLPNPEKGSQDGLEVDDEGRVKGWEGNAAHVREVFGRMGFSDREMVALITGGHVYGRCHQESSGYAGAWVENPTFFSNEYAADLIGDKWMLVGHDSKLPDGREIPPEIRPAPGKRQYVDMSKLMPDEEEEKERSAPDSAQFKPGLYKCVSDWVNIRDQADVSSSIVGRIVHDMSVNLVAVKVFGTAIRGQAERGGWVSIVGSGGKTLFERQGSLDLQKTIGKWRKLNDKVPVFANSQAAGNGKSVVPSEEFNVSEVQIGTDENTEGAVFGKIAEGSWALLYSPKRGLLAELIIEGYNEKRRKPIKGQDGYQMMLISDMVMLWDPVFRAVTEDYAEDVEKLKKEFGAAFKRLTELGCPWSKDRPNPLFKSPQGGGCPFACN